MEDPQIEGLGDDAMVIITEEQAERLQVPRRCRCSLIRKALEALDVATDGDAYMEL